MPLGIDHCVIAVKDLETAIASYTELGFTVVRGGKHNIGTHNALIAFQDGSYLELIAFLNPVEGHPWYKALAKGGGLVDFCGRTHDIDHDVHAYRAAGASIGDPFAMTRTRPDGYELKWKLATPDAPFNGLVPFVIWDETPRDERVPRDRTHRNGVTGIKRIAIACHELNKTAELYHRILGIGGARIDHAELDCAGVRIPFGTQEIDLIAPRSLSGPVVKFLDLHGQAPYEVTLAGSPRAAFDLAQTHGARLRIE